MTVRKVSKQKGKSAFYQHSSHPTLFHPHPTIHSLWEWKAIGYVFSYSEAYFHGGEFLDSHVSLYIENVLEGLSLRNE